MRKLLCVVALLCLPIIAAAVTSPMPYVKIQFLDNSGAPCAGCTLSSFSAGTSTPLATYTDASGLSQNTNPIVLDSAGRANIWLGTNSYKFVLKDANGVTLWTVDNVTNSWIVSQSNTWTGTNTFTGTTIFTGTVTMSGTTNTKSLNGIRFCDQYATGGSGSSGSPWTGWESCVTGATAGQMAFFPTGYYAHPSPITITASIEINGTGSASRLKYTGTATTSQFLLSGSGLNNTKFVVRNIQFDANGLASYAFDVIKSAGSVFENIDARNATVGAMRCRNCVADSIIHPVVSSNEEAFTTIPQYGMIFDTDGTGACGGETITAPKIEGVSAHGLWLKNIITSTIVGGTSEGNGTGVYMDAGAGFDQIFGIDLEANTVHDVYVAGTNNTISPSSATSAGGSVYTSGARGNNTFGGIWSTITVDNVNAYGNSFHDLRISAVPTDSGTQTNWYNLYNFAGAAYFDSVIQGARTFQYVAKASSATPIIFSSADSSNPFRLTFLRSIAGAGAYWAIQSEESGVAYRNLVVQTSGGNLLVGSSTDSASGAKLQVTGATQSGSYETTTNCNSAAAPAVCGSAAAGSVVIAAASTNVVVNTTAVTANSQILLTQDDSLGTRLGVTCNTNWFHVAITGRTAGTGFTIVADSAPVTNPLCLSYLIIN